MTFKEYKNILEADRIAAGGKKNNHFYMIITNECYKLIVCFRKCELLRELKILKILYFIARWKYRHLCLKYGCDIPSSVKIGKGFSINHPVGIVINSKVVIGNNCNIKSGVLIGKTEKGVPVIGDNVKIGAHAILLGGITVGNNVKVGAGAIVVHDVADNQTVVNSYAHVLC